tara:strand:+ start:3169 stop:3747 length:579 start_codon:yes stop_codon:yes gene_type:complete
MFNGCFAEGQSGQAFLLEGDPKAFDMLASWLYSGKVYNADHRQRAYIELFILAEKYDIVRLADNTMDAYVHAVIFTRHRPTSTLCAAAYEGTQEESKIQLFMSRYWAYGLINDEDKGNWLTSTFVPLGEKAQEILIDGMGHLRNMNNMKLSKGQKLMCNPKFAPLCDYHQYGKDQVCPYAKPMKRKLDESNV